MKKIVLFVLLLTFSLSRSWAEECARFYLGANLRFEPGQGKNAGFGEFHWGGISEVFYGTIVFGISSKAFLSSIQLKNPDVVKLLDNLVQSENEFYIGSVIDKIFYRKTRELEIEDSERLFYAPSLVGGPNVLPGFGFGGRLEAISNFVSKKAEKDPSCYLAGGLYATAYYATNLLAIYPMIGIGLNEGLDYHFVVEERNEIKKAFLPRLKLRIDISSRRSLLMYGTKSHLFLSFQYEWPIKVKNILLRLEDGTLVQASRLREAVVRLGISIDL